MLNGTLSFTDLSSDRDSALPDTQINRYIKLQV